MEPLLPHFLQFYEQDEQVSPPLKLEACARIQVRLVWLLLHSRGQLGAQPGCASCMQEAPKQVLSSSGVLQPCKIPAC